MNWLHPRRVAYVVPMLFALPFLAGASGNGCSSVPIGSGAPGGDAGAGSDGSASCTQADCAGLGATTEAKVCPDGSAVGRSVCTRESDGRCAWDFPACPPADAGAQCPNLGCAPQCPNGVLNDANGCETCQCAPAVDAGAACQTDANCGGGICGFPVADGCTAVGTCFPRPRITCAAYSPGCACDGTEVNDACNGLPTGYAPRPLLHTGMCAVDAGACCPTSWDLYQCTDADGGSGMACHNPQLGCASSTTCGAGCDQVVSGRCGP